MYRDWTYVGDSLVTNTASLCSITSVGAKDEELTLICGPGVKAYPNMCVKGVSSPLFGCQGQKLILICVLGVDVHLICVPGEEAHPLFVCPMCQR